MNTIVKQARGVADGRSDSHVTCGNHEDYAIQYRSPRGINKLIELSVTCLEPVDTKPNRDHTCDHSILSEAKREQQHLALCDLSIGDVVLS